MKLPVPYDPDPAASSVRTQAMVVREGRDAYRAGLAEDAPSGRFIDPDMTIDWHNGFRWEREIHEQERPKCECAGCRRERIIKRITNGR